MSDSGKTDQALLDEYVLRGCDEAFAELARRHQAMAFATAYRICGDRGEAQDILQQAFIVLARRAGELGKVGCLSAWLHRVVVLESKKSRRKSANRRHRETMAHQISELSAVEPTFARKIAPELDESLDAMSGKDREVLTLHYLEGQSFKSIATSLGGTAEAWQKRSVRALEKLAHKLKNRGITVSTAALGAFFTTTRAEAGLSSSILEEITRHALDKSVCNVTGLAGTTAAITAMKTGITCSLVSGVVLAYGWGVVMTPQTSEMNSIKPAGISQVEPESGPASRDKRGDGFTLELVKQAVTEYDEADKPDELKESRLRSLMFLVPGKYLEDVFQILKDTKDHGRFQQIAAAFFGRWAEHDPVTALASAKEAGVFSYQARRAVMITWLNQDDEGALAVMLEDKSNENRGFLTEFLTYQCERKPQDAAALVDRLANAWPEADRHLFGRVARLWARTDALAAGNWVASYWDEQVKRNLLGEIAVSTAKTRGFDGLTIANQIEDDAARQRARNQAINWWGVTSGGISLIPGEARPVRDLSKGFPDDWTDENIRTFAFGTMVNYSKNLPDLLKIAKDDGQRILIYEGAVRGSAWSDPAAVAVAAEQLPDGFANTEQGRDTLKAFIKRWSEMDANGARSWLSKQPPGAKTDALRAGLNGEGAK